jgi:chromosome segregation ATPase
MEQQEKHHHEHEGQLRAENETLRKKVHELERDNSSLQERNNGLCTRQSDCQLWLRGTERAMERGPRSEQRDADS